MSAERWVEGKSPARSRQHYIREKFAEAVGAYHVEGRPLRERLYYAWLRFYSVVGETELPPAVASLCRELKARMTWTEGCDGSRFVEKTRGLISDEECERLFEVIRQIYIAAGVEEDFPPRRTPPSRPGR